MNSGTNLGRSQCQPVGGMLQCAMSERKSTFVVFFGLIAVLPYHNAVEVHGNFTISNHAIRSRVLHEEKLECVFDVTFAGITAERKVTLEFSGENVLLSNKALKTLDSWLIDEKNPEDQKLAQTKVEQMLEDDGSRNTQLSFDVNTRLSGSSKTLLRLKGTVIMIVKENAPIGSLIRPQLHMKTDLNWSLPDGITIFADYVFIQTPSFTIQPADPPTIGLRDQSVVTSVLRLPAGPLDDAYAMVYMPCNHTSEEPYLSINNFNISSTAGLDPDTESSLQQVKAIFSSRTRTSENEEAQLDLPEVELQQDTGEVRLTVTFKMLDFVGYDSDFNMDVGFAIMVKNSWIYVGSSKVNTTSKPPLRPMIPDLSVRLDHVFTYELKDHPVVALQARVFHTATSLSSAYNISLNIYLMQLMSFEVIGKFSDIIKSGPQMVTIKTSYIVFEIERLSFVHDAKVMFNISLDVTQEKFSSTELFNVVAEVVYLGWRSDEEYGTMTLTGISLPRKIYKDIHKQIGGACKDSGKSSATCTHCTKGLCDCGPEYPDVCVDCRATWKCIRHLPEFYQKSRLLYFDRTIACEAKQKYRPGRTDVSCTKQTSEDKFKALSPTVSVVTGYDKENGDTYGISNHGLGYVLSQDGGRSWFTISKHYYDKEKAKETFVPATMEG